MVTALILAAGASSRYGGANKLLLPFTEGTVIRRVVSTVLAADVPRIIVITGHQREQVEEALALMPVEFIHNSRFREGEMVSSIKAGLTHLEKSNAGAALIVLGDQPLLPAWIIRRVAQAFEQNCSEIIAPKFGAVRGHPVLIARKWWAEAQALPDGAQMRDLLKVHPEAVAHILVNTDAVLKDVDTPELYEQALRRIEN